MMGCWRRTRIMSWRTPVDGPEKKSREAWMSTDEEVQERVGIDTRGWNRRLDVIRIYPLPIP